MRLGQSLRAEEVVVDDPLVALSRLGFKDFDDTAELVVLPPRVTELVQNRPLVPVREWRVEQYIVRFHGPQNFVLARPEGSRR